MKLKRNRKVPQDVFDTLAPIHNVMRVFSLTSISRVNGDLNAPFVRIYWSRHIVVIFTFALTVILATVYKSNLLFAAEHSNDKIKFMDLLQLVYVFESVQYIVDMSYVFKLRKSTLHYLKHYAKIDKILGPTTYNKRIKKIIYKITISWCLVCFLLVLCDLLTCLFLLNYYDDTVMKFTYVLEETVYFINNLTIIDMCSQIIQIEYRLQKVEYILSNIYFSTRNRIENGQKIADEDKWLSFATYNKTTKKRLNELSDFDDVSQLNVIYLMLTEQIDYINKMYGVRIMLTNIYQLWMLISEINYAIWMLTEDTEFIQMPILTFITCMWGVFFGASILAFTAPRAEKAYEQRMRIINVVDQILIQKDINEKTMATLKKFRSLVHSRNIKITAAKFYPINYGLIVTFSSVVTTYSLLLFDNIE